MRQQTCLWLLRDSSLKKVRFYALGLILFSGSRTRRAKSWITGLHSWITSIFPRRSFTMPSKRNCRLERFRAWKFRVKYSPRVAWFRIVAFICDCFENVWPCTPVLRLLAPVISFPVARYMSRRWSDYGTLSLPCFPSQSWAHSWSNHSECYLPVLLLPPSCLP